MSKRLPRNQCRNCGSEVKRAIDVYCNNKCQHNFELRKWIAEWISGNLVLVGDRPLKKALIFLNGEKCQKCGWCERHPVTGKVPVELEHKDGNYKNNRPQNVTLLCPNCHSLTPTFRALNKGKGREFRRKAAVAQ